MDELDVIILGGYFGKGRRSKILSHFLCGVMSAGDKPTYHSMARVSLLVHLCAPVDLVSVR